MTKTRRTFGIDGVEFRPSVLEARQLESIRNEVSVDHPIIRRSGVRNLEKKFSSIASAARNPQVLSIAESLLDAPARLVRALVFDKTPASNWFVGWHQDRTVTLNQRSSMAGWRNWTLKDGVHHVQPPREVLDRMVAIRLHVDAADEDNGCLRVIPGSHRLGILPEPEIKQHVLNLQAISCIANPGDAVIMHPLTLHSSLKSRTHRQRRVIHLEYSSYDLPAGLSWA